MFLIVFIVADVFYSFLQHYYFPLDGDLPGIVAPSPGYTPVLKDPFGFAVFFNDVIYPNPNRFFAHSSMHYYFNYAPLVIQQITDPVKSLYVAAGLAKTFFQLLLLWLLAAFISGTLNPVKSKFIVAAALAVPLFQQAHGFYMSMALIDMSISYAFFYAFPMGLLLLFFFPFYRSEFYNKPLKLNLIVKALLVLLAVVLAFHGPIIPATSIVVCALAIGYKWVKIYRQNPSLPFLSALRKIPRPILFYFSLLSALSFYSLYIGMHNSESLNHTISLSERYIRLPAGIYDILTIDKGLSLLTGIIVLNFLLVLMTKKTGQRQKLLFILKWIGVFSAIYLLLLPLGGYREYRPNIIRYDSIIPILVLLYYFFGISTYYLLKQLQSKTRLVYAAVVVVILFIFTRADNLVRWQHACEKGALEQIAASEEDVVPVKAECTIISWGIIHDPQESELHARLLQRWRITKEKKLFYQE